MGVLAYAGGQLVGTVTPRMAQYAVFAALVLALLWACSRLNPVIWWGMP